MGSLKEGVQRDRGTTEQQPKGKVRRWSSNPGGCKGVGLGRTGLGVLPAAGDLGPRAPHPNAGLSTQVFSSLHPQGSKPLAVLDMQRVSRKYLCADLSPKGPGKRLVSLVAM